MKEINIREATLPDIGLLQQISRQTFYETFAVNNTGQDMAKYLKENFSSVKLTSELSNKNSRFYFAMFNNDVIGYLKLNFGEAQTELKENKAQEIERIYVLQEFHGKNIAQMLYQTAIRVAEQMDVEYWLGVWERNPRAIRFYTKNGFVEFDKHIFRLGNDEQTDILMKLQLKRVSHSTSEGLVKNK